MSTVRRDQCLIGTIRSPLVEDSAYTCLSVSALAWWRITYIGVLATCQIRLGTRFDTALFCEELRQPESQSALEYRQYPRHLLRRRVSIVDYGSLHCLLATTQRSRWWRGSRNSNRKALDKLVWAAY